MNKNIVITGIGLITPLGDSPRDILARIGCAETAFSRHPFDSDVFHCPYYAAINDFDFERLFPDNKMLRMMNRDAQLAVAAAYKAMRDAKITVDETYPSDDIALYGSTGMAGLALQELTGLIRNAAGDSGTLDLARFGSVALKRTRPVLSFKILANMPICFVSIFENIRGPNAIYTPWEGQGAYAIAAGVRAIRRGDVSCALVGGCDVKTHAISLIGLQQNRAFDSWQTHLQGTVPAEGAAFLVLEDETHAAGRKAHVYARLKDFRIRSLQKHVPRVDTFREILAGLRPTEDVALLASSDGDPISAQDELNACRQVNLQPIKTIRPKEHLGNLYAGAAAVQVGLAAAMIAQAAEDKAPRAVMANCFGLGDEQAAFALEAI